MGQLSEFSRCTKHKVKFDFSASLPILDHGKKCKVIAQCFNVAFWKFKSFNWQIEVEVSA